mmetsp:Transcript_41934/g.115658  ORF Transcript_41934/g.115658 Transcript_41934/m.115658 type:complete len:574 (-) Transcript_41934:54-1775(-)
MPSARRRDPWLAATTSVALALATAGTGLASLRASAPHVQAASRLGERLPASSRAGLRGVYCVGRQSDQHRLAYMQRWLGTLGVHVERWNTPGDLGLGFCADAKQRVENGLVEPAALPRSMVSDELREHWRATRRWRPVRRGPWVFGIDLTRSALGHALSHMDLWAELLRRGTGGHEASPCYLVLDDDCHFLPSFGAEALEARLAEVPWPWDLVFLGGTEVLGAQTRYDVTGGVRKLHPWFRPAGAYVVTLAGAQAALKACTPLRWNLYSHLTGSHAASARQLGAEERLFAPTATPVGYYLVPPLVRGPRKDPRSDVGARQRRTGGTRGHGTGENSGESAWASADVDSRGVGLSDEAEQELQQLIGELDTVIAWSMRLTDRPVPRGSRERDIEGHSNLIPEARRVMSELASHPAVETICEIGFNGGHGTLRWLHSSKAKVYSFDLGEHDYSRPAASWLQARFPGRLTVTWGDSVETLPEFHARHPDVECDLVFVDGGHSYEVALADLKNFAAMANPRRHRILMDDTHLSGPDGAWRTLLDAGNATELGRSSGSFVEGVGSYGFVIGNFTALALQ